MDTHTYTGDQCIELNEHVWVKKKKNLGTLRLVTYINTLIVILYYSFTNVTMGETGQSEQGISLYYL